MYIVFIFAAVPSSTRSSLVIKKVCYYNIKPVSETFNPIALRKAKIACNFGLSKCSRVKHDLHHL